MAPNQFIDIALAESARGGTRAKNAPLARNAFLWNLVQSCLIAPSPRAYFGWWRRYWWRLFGMKIGVGVRMPPSVRINCPWNVTIGNHVWVGEFAEFLSFAPIEIGNDAVISQYVYLCAGTHDYSKLSFPLVAKPVKIEDEVWVATGSFISPGVTVGKGSIIGAKSVVLHDVPPEMIYAGNPAKPIRKRPAATSASSGD